MRNPTLLYINMPEGSVTITLRDLAAIALEAALTSDLSHQPIAIKDQTPEGLARVGIERADALLAELEKEKP